MGIGKFLLELTNLFTIYRWNNRPGIIRFTEADNAFHTTTLSLFAMNDLNAEDTINMVHNKIIKEIPKIILSDVSLETKNKIKSINPTIWNDVINESYKDLNLILDNENLSKKLFIEKNINEEINKTTDLVKLLVSKKEVELNERVFPEYYSLPKKEIDEEIKKINTNFSKKVFSISDYLLNSTIRLNTMIRWNKNHRNVRSSVSSHSFYVLITAYILALNNDVNGELLKEIMIASILHDIPEAFTGDVITPTKRKVKGLESLIGKVEDTFVDEWSTLNPNINEIMKKYKNYMLEPFNKEYGRYVRSADLLAAMNECAAEIITGNQDDIFRKAFFTSKKELKIISPYDLSDILDEIEYNTFK
ncbi:hydrolase [Tepiditoga spiralis]|uniref:Hydrolase n=1 Tax=Tepiditoga spiralis TaxID=2108365 RepID=A0A7G1GBU8_9BACT|nr:YfbR-like 5'-deoxynucleotidase [Tepiditoga spiralis]BBE31379.1 hydrolase [Tepiditoga spiralis]